MANTLRAGAAPGAESRRGVTVLHLLDGPYLTVAGSRQEIPEGSKRVVAFLAFHRPHLDRRLAAGSLWADCVQSRAAGNLRSALWRLRGAGIDVIDSDRHCVGLAGGLRVDLDAIRQWTERVIDRRPDVIDLEPAAWQLAGRDLLPSWDDGWLTVERERLAQRTLRALESATRQLAERRRYADAVEVAMQAIVADPLRESAHRALVEVFIAEGNRSQALQAFDRCRKLLRSELGLDPSRELAAVLWPEPMDGRRTVVPVQRPSVGAGRLVTSPH